MVNILLFLASCGIVVAAAVGFARMGKSALTSWIALLSLLANLFVIKQIELFGFNATASDVFAIGSLFGLNLLQEKYGSQAAKQAIWTSFGCLIFFVVMAQIHLLYQPSPFDETQTAFVTLLGSSPRILIASLLTFFIAQQVDRGLYQQLRSRLPQVSMVWLSSSTLVVSQLLDTVLFSLLGLYGMVAAIGEIIIISYTIKLLAIAATLPWSVLSRKYLTHAN